MKKIFFESSLIYSLNYLLHSFERAIEFERYCCSFIKQTFHVCAAGTEDSTVTTDLKYQYFNIF